MNTYKSWQFGRMWVAFSFELMQFLSLGVQTNFYRDGAFVTFRVGPFTLSIDF